MMMTTLLNFQQQQLRRRRRCESESSGAAGLVVLLIAWAGFANLCCASNVTTDYETATQYETTNNATNDGSLDTSNNMAAGLNDTSTGDYDSQHVDSTLSSNSSNSTGPQNESMAVSSKRDYAQEVESFWKNVLIGIRDWLRGLIDSIQQLIDKMN